VLKRLSRASIEIDKLDGSDDDDDNVENDDVLSCSQMCEQDCTDMIHLFYGMNA